MATPLINGDSTVPYNLQVSYPSSGTGSAVVYSIVSIPSDNAPHALSLPSRGLEYFDVKSANFYVRLKTGYDATALSSGDYVGGQYASTLTVTMNAN